MKKLFLTMLAAVTLLASCSKEETPGQINGEESLVTFTLSTDQLATKAVGDGTSAKTLYYAVYHEGQQQVTIIDKVSDMDGVSAFEDGLTHEVPIQLLNGETYSIIFWADAGTGTACSVNWTDKKMTFTPAVANAEAYDAFYAYVKPFTVTGSKNETVKLYRPFAQINIGTTDGDLAELAKYYGLSDGAYKYSQIKVSSTYNTLDLVAGTVSSTQSSTQSSLSYGYSDFTSAFKEENFPVSGYEFLSMNYVLVPSDKELIDVEFEIATDEQGANSVKRVFSNVPVQRNYRTNVYGDLYASTFNYEVEITPSFEEEYQVLSGVVTLNADTEWKETMVVLDNAVIDLNGHKLTYSGEDYLMARVQDGATLTFYGDKPGSALVSTGYIASANQGGTINVISGNYTTTEDVTCFQTNGGTLNIVGGVFEALQSYNDKYWTINRVSNKGTVTISGGTFIKFNPANNLVDNPIVSFVKDGYMSLEISTDVFVIVKEGSTKSDVTLASDLNLFSSLTVATLDGGNNTLKSTAHKAVVSNGVSIKNVTLNGGADYAKDKDGNYLLNSSGKKLSTRAIWLEKATSDVVIENVTVRDAGYAFNTGSGIGDNLKLTVSNSTFENWMSYDGFASASFSNCNFEVGSYFEQGSEFNGGMRPYVETLFENCNFESGFKVDSYCVVNAGKSNERVVSPKLTFKNCKHNGVLLTSSNISELLFADDEETSNNVIVQ